MTEAIIAAMAAIFGGAGLKVVESILTKSKDKADVATQLRDELRVETGTLRKELKEVERRLDSSREAYYAVLHAYNMAKSKLIAAGLVKEADEVSSYLNKRSPLENPQDNNI